VNISLSGLIRKNKPPARYPAAALDYLSQVGIENVTRYEQDLLAHATAGLATVPGLRLLGTAREKAGVLSFVLDGIRTEEVGKALDEEGIAVRAGTTAPSRSCAASGWKAQFAPRWPCTTPARTSTLSSLLSCASWLDVEIAVLRASLRCPATEVSRHADGPH
jgi:selenocysteine lyase/cysteine desulfurase